MTLSRRRRLRPLLAAPVALAAIAAGCSGSTTTQGEIVVAIQTDLSLPKDVSAVRIQITTLGVVRFDNTYPVGPDPSMRIPATIGLLPGENPDSPVRIRVVGYKKEHEPRILREVVTTVPPSRVVSLRLPLQWLSDGSAIRDPLSAGDPFAFQNSCQDGTTNIGAVCVDSHINSATLPDYDPQDIFGGGDETGAGGTCFDTQACLAARTSAVPIAQGDGTCVMAAPQGGDPSKVNVGIEFGTGGDGICADAQGSGPCFIPLDRVDSASDGLGWYAGTEPPPGGTGTSGGSDADGGTGGSLKDAGASGPADAGTGPGSGGLHIQAGDAPTGSTPFTTIHLPAGLCAKVSAAGFTGKVVVSQTCDSKTPKNPTCGPWSSVQSATDGGTSGGNDASVPDSSAEDAPQGTDSGKDGSIGPGPGTPIASGQAGASGLVVDSAAGDSGNVVWSIAGAGLHAVAKTGGNVVELVTPQGQTSANAFHILHDGTGLIDPNGFGTDSFQNIVWSYLPASDGGTGTFTPFVIQENVPRGITLSSGQLVWASADGVRTCNPVDCSPFTVMPPGAPPHAFDVVDDETDFGYYATAGDSFIYWCAASGCDMFEQRMQNPGGAGNNIAIARDATGLYWIDEATPGQTNGHVYATAFADAFPDGGVPVTTLASNIDTSPPSGEVHRGIAVDGTFVYYAAGDGVFAVPKVGGPIVTLANGMQRPAAIALDANNVYWSDVLAGVIYRASKPVIP